MTEHVPSDNSSENVSTQQQKCPYAMVGIALVVEQQGKGARMVLRYPAQPTEASAEDDLFFRLPPRQMAKLFRPKPALCGQPMTLSVGGTVFCCFATLMADETNNDEANNEEDTATTEQPQTKSHRLALFSVIVALAPQVRISSIPVSGWSERSNSFDNNNLEGKQLDGAVHHHHHHHHGSRRASASFLSMRRVHVSLARLCRVLEREERRCSFISLQADFFQRIRNDVQKKWQESNSAKAMSSSSASSPVSMVSKSTPVVPSERKRHHQHRRVSSLTSFADRDSTSERPTTRGQTTTGTTRDDQLHGEQDQEVLDIIMAAAPDDFQHTTAGTAAEMTYHQGNLARELIQVYHALARNDEAFPPSPADLLTGRSGTVYINQHIAVVIEALSPIHCGISNDKNHPLVRPYHTLLFPKASPSQLLESLKASGAAAPRRLQQFLLAVHPQKTLQEIAFDASLPLQVVLEMASYLVSQGACLISPTVLSRHSRLACSYNMATSIHNVSLAFSQTFGLSANLFVLVSFLTESGRTLGESITTLVSSSDKQTVWLRERMEAALAYRRTDYWARAAATSATTATTVATTMTSTTLQQQQQPPPASLANTDIIFADTVIHATTPATATETTTATTQQEIMQRRVLEELEELLYQMALWLRSREVLIPLLDFLVAVSSASFVDATAATVAAANLEDSDVDHHRQSQDDKGEKKVELNHQRGAFDNTRMDDDDALFQALLDADCLQGRTPFPCCCLKTGLDAARLRAFALRSDRIRVVTRVPEAGDDW